MIDVRALVQRLIAAGVDPVEAAVIATDVVTSARSDGATARQERNRRYYEARKERLKASENKTIKTDQDAIKTVSDGSDADRPLARVVNTTLPSEELNNPLRPPSEDLPPTGGDDRLAKPDPPKPKRARGTRLPEDWRPDERDLTVAREEGLTPEEIHRAATEFRNYWCSRSRDAAKLDWHRTWHNRVIEIGDRKRRNGARLASAPAQPRGGGRGSSSFADIFVQRHGVGAD